MRQALTQAMANFPKGRVLVVGDAAIDEMIYGATARLSREAPVVILRHERTDIVLGAASNAAHNIAALGARHTALVGVCGADYHGGQLREALARDGVDAQKLIEDPHRPTTTKTRLSGIANHSVTQQIVRIDRESTQPIAGAVENAVLDAISQLAPAMDALLISDYGLGVVTDAVIAHCKAMARRHGLILTADSQRELALFAGADMISPNQPEAERNAGFDFDNEALLVQGGRELLARTGVQRLLITLGANGMRLFDDTGGNTPIPAFNRSEVFDVTGAGDTVIGALTLARATGADSLTACVLGNLAASLTVRRFGAAVTSCAEMAEALAELDDALLARIARHTPVVSPS